MRTESWMLQTLTDTREQLPSLTLQRQQVLLISVHGGALLSIRFFFKPLMLLRMFALRKLNWTTYENKFYISSGFFTSGDNRKEHAETKALLTGR